MEKEGQPCKGHDHAVREGRPRHQGRPRQTRKRILGHVCVRVQPNRLRIDYAMVQATDQATLLRWRHLRTCYWLPGSYPLPEFEIPGYISAAILLSTLPSDPRDPHSVAS